MEKKDGRRFPPSEEFVRFVVNDRVLLIHNGYIHGPVSEKSTGYNLEGEFIVYDCMFKLRNGDNSKLCDCKILERRSDGHCFLEGSHSWFCQNVRDGRGVVRKPSSDTNQSEDNVKISGGEIRNERLLDSRSRESETDLFIHKCGKCGMDSKFQCSRCKSVHYCSKKCQKLHWSSHKSKCVSRNKKQNKELKYKELGEEIKKDPRYFSKLSKSEQNDPILIRYAIERNSEGVYSEYPFMFTKERETQKKISEEIELEEDRHYVAKYLQDNKYELLKKIGEGSYAEAFLIEMYFEKLKKDKLFVLKLCKLSPEEKNQELPSKGDLMEVKHHRNIAPLIYPTSTEKVEIEIDKKKFPHLPPNYFMNRRIPFIVTRYYRRDLYHYLEARVKINKPLLDCEVCYILLGILKGALHLHEHNIVHRDLHPKNIFIDEVAGRVWIGDFGLSLLVKDWKMDSFGEYKSRSIYSAPELFRDIAPNFEKSDLYSIGKIGEFTILTFFNEKIEGGLDGIKGELFSPDLIDFIQKLLVEDPEERIGYRESIRELEVLIKNFEVVTGELRYESGGKDEKEKQANRYFQQARKSARFGNVSSEAVVLFTKALQILEDYFYDNHWGIFLCLYNIGSLKQRMGEFRSSIYYYKECLGILQEHFGRGYRHISGCCSSLGFCYLQLKEFEKAKNMYGMSLYILLTFLPNEDREVADGLRYLAGFYQVTNETERSLMLYHECLEKEEKLLRLKKKVRIDITYYNLANLYAMVERFHDALEYYEKCLGFRLAHLPKNHSSLGNVYNNMGMIHLNFGGNFKKSRECFLLALKIRENSYDSGHQILTDTRENVGLTYEKEKKYLEALSCYMEDVPRLQESVDRVQKLYEEVQKRRQEEEEQQQQKKKKIGYKKIYGVKEIQGVRGGKLVVYGNYRYRLKSSFRSKKMNRDFRVFYCTSRDSKSEEDDEQRCRCSIRKDLSSGSFYHSMKGLDRMEHTSSCVPLIDPRKIRARCNYCDGVVEIRDEKVFHKCKGKSRNVCHNGTPILDLRVIHVNRSSKTKHTAGEEWWVKRKCSECGFARGDNVIGYALGKRSLTFRS